MELDKEFWAGKRVFLTGHTGFKGAWLALLLQELGADVFGYSLAPSDERALSQVVKLERSVTSVIAPLEDRGALAEALKAAKPDVVLHLAAQPLVRLAYDRPLETLETNVMGTAYLLDALRGLRAGIAVVVTSDKCYRNDSEPRSFVERDPMGGRDPYSASKGAAELIVSCYRESFLNELGWKVASARSGNIFGGGDWARDRIVPDYFRAMESGSVLRVRSPEAVRPWLYVLDSLSGYLLLAQACQAASSGGGAYDNAWNFGPEEGAVRTVREVVEAFSSAVSQPPGVEIDQGAHPYEAKYLMLDCSKARALLGWRASLGFEAGVAETASWYSAYLQGEDMEGFSRRQVRSYLQTFGSER